MTEPNTLAAVLTRIPNGENAYGRPVYRTEVKTYPGVYWPGGSQENDDDRTQVSWQTTVCLPAEADVSAVDAVIPQVRVDARNQPVLDADGNVQGDEYEVDAQPTIWPTTPWGWRPEFPVQLALTRKAG